jgi:hypothetical protein
MIVNGTIPPSGGCRPPPKVALMSKRKLPQDLQDWIEARKRFGLSHAQVQMARELGMNPRKLGKLDNMVRSRGRRRCHSSSSTCT